MPQPDALNIATPASGIDKRIVMDAANWLVKLHSQEMDASDHASLKRWCEQSTEHQRAWHAANELARNFGAVPAGLGLTTLGRQRNRRAAMKTLAIVCTLAPTSWLAWTHMARDNYQTATGERSTYTLADGSSLMLNTGSSVDIVFDDKQRLLRLRAGEVLVQTAKDSAPNPRPFIVQTGQGSVRALGTRFIVRQREDATEVAVLEHAVEVRALGVADPVIIAAGYGGSFGKTDIAALTPLANNVNASAWTQGILIADRQRLEDFLAELGRYRPGILRCDPAVADLRISGVFQTSNTEQALNVLQETLPVTVLSRTRYWVTVLPAQDS
ncbi:Fe2+-dicitrate sensor, membrane component [Janthinobacterium sp. Marseille]|nr:FecR domain-containing protein [Janthinobacterium sp. Marseille]ABR89315.1 Fe2+-dicitrate sensor, membrane component [Janthinobacterium sp. Marseille]